MKTPLALVLAIEALAIAALLTVALDQYAHKRVERLGGVNSRGYRGTVVRARAQREARIAVVGGDFAFGWGMAEAETTAGYLRTMLANALNRSGDAVTVVTSINLGARGLPAVEYPSRIEQFAGLAPDVWCLYVDLADSQPGSVMPPFDSGVTRLTGYVPMLPIVIEEKGLTTIGRGLKAIDRTLYRLVGGRRPEAASADRLAAIERAIDLALAPPTTKAVVVILPVPLDDSQRVEHGRILAAALARASGVPRMGVVDLAAHPRFSAPELRLDGVSYSAGGNSLVAQEVGPVIVDLLSRQTTS
jgi:hypothetical protein